MENEHEHSQNIAEKQKRLLPKWTRSDDVAQDNYLDEHVVQTKVAECFNWTEHQVRDLDLLQLMYLIIPLISNSILTE